MPHNRPGRNLTSAERAREVFGMRISECFRFLMETTFQPTSQVNMLGATGPHHPTASGFFLGALRFASRAGAVLDSQ